MSRFLSLLLTATLVVLPLFSAGCDDALPVDPIGQGDPDGADPDDDDPPVGAIDVEVLAETFGCEVAVVGAVAETAGALDAEGGCTLDDGRMADHYAFALDGFAEPFYVEAYSDEFDTVVYLYDADGALLGENDDMGEGHTNSVLVMPLDPGVYVAVVAPFDTDQSGAYSFVTKW